MIETERLTLRRWEAHDRAALRAQCDDADVMRFLLPVADDTAFEAMLTRFRDWETEHGFTFWVVERRSDAAAIGICGLKTGTVGTPIDGMVEIGWRLAREAWGQGYAGEASQAVLDLGWRTLPVEEIVAITVPANQASWRLMERLGMTRIEDGDFDHPAVAPDSPLRRHILYRIARPR